MQVDTLILGARVFNSYIKRFEVKNAALLDSRFFYIGDRGPADFQADSVVHAEGKWMIPGLIDIHLHIESSMVSPAVFSEALLERGITTIVPEPHEMANVFGLEGVQQMINVSRECAVDMFYAIPSSVPATDWETTGGSIAIEDVETLIQSESVACMGEIMNYNDIVQQKNGRTLELLDYLRRHHPAMIIEGHVPRLMDLDLQRMLYAGVNSDHTHQTVEGLEERIKAGMFVEIQEKSMSAPVMDYLIQEDVNEHFCFVTDDIMPDDLHRTGHLDMILRKAVRMGMSPEDALYACTFTPARRMGFSDRGAIKAGSNADFVLLNDLETFTVDRVYKNGKPSVPYQAVDSDRKAFPDSFYKSIRLSDLSGDDFRIPVLTTDVSSLQRVIMVKDGSTFTTEEQHDITVSGQELLWENSSFGLLSTFERYGRNGNHSHVLIGGDVLDRGAVATSYSHDNHNLLVAGHSASDMALAANEVIAHQGGICVVENGEVLAMIYLPVGGILTEEPLQSFAPKVQKVRDALKQLGYRHYNPFMSLSTLSLPVSPALKLTDQGLIDVQKGCIVSTAVND
ncbi:adenine deaminase [Sinobaca qinghaiensis]|uniref:Adenine deaminase n=1 Tax=Sinobaca qinghaiensis TaxID=342944 RepID=A0A419V067_9BACL|nr:adenine deaminase C-terminal domain-containing protein [Sinobaca qinghaiensis]RKD71323.1 adenine deaminase [Sinobaca qinghaiensis]